MRVPCMEAERVESRIVLFVLVCVSHAFVLERLIGELAGASVWLVLLQEKFRSRHFTRAIVARNELERDGDEKESFDFSAMRRIWETDDAVAMTTPTVRP